MRPGDEFGGRYVLTKVIGAGRSGDVWLAHDTVTGQDVALKPERIEGDRDTEGRRLLGEPRAMAKFRDHPHVVTLLDVVAVDQGEGGEEGGESAYWFIMDYVPGGGLDRQLPMSPERVARIGAQLADALAALHDAGIVHCDVKPANIGLTRRGDAKLLDFGAAYRFGGTETVSVNGPFSFTPDYAAPELARGNIPRPASDVFGLAATLHALVAGSPPRGREPDEDGEHGDQGEQGEHRDDGEAAHRLTYWKAEQGVVEMDVEALGPLRPVLAAMLRRDPRQRPDAAEAGRLLAAVAADPDSRRTEDTPLPRPRRRWPVLAGAAIGVAALVLGLVVFLDGDGDGDGSGDGGGGGGPSATEDPPNGEAQSGISDPHTIEMCALTDPAVFSAYGRAEVDEDYGNFDRCDTYVYLDDDETRVDVAIRLLHDSPSGKSQPDRFIGETGIIEEPPEDGECLLTLVPPDGDGDGILVGIRVDVGNGSVDGTESLCGIAEEAAEEVAEVLNQGSIPSRSSDYPPDSLAWLNACDDFLDAEALATVPGVDPEAPEHGVGNWDCEWLSDNLEAELIFHRDQHREAPDVRRFSGYDTTVEPRADGEGTCTAFVHYRDYPGQDGQLAFEMLRLRVGGERPMDELCDMVADLAASAAAELPAP